MTMTISNKNRKLRNLCAIGVIALYAIINVIGLTALRPLGPFAYQYGYTIVRVFMPLLALILVGLYVAFCWLGAWVRGWSGWLGVLVASVGLLMWFGVAVALLYQNVNNGFDVSNPARVYDDRLPWVMPFVFGVSAGVLQALPVRTRRATPPATQEA